MCVYVSVCTRVRYKFGEREAGDKQIRIGRKNSRKQPPTSLPLKEVYIKANIFRKILLPLPVGQMPE